MKRLAALLLGLNLIVNLSAAARDWVVYEGKNGPGAGKHIVLVSGDEEYRSEEALPMLGKILAVRHGFKCTVLFPINPADGTIDPNNQTNIVGLDQVATADLVVLFLRFREPPDDQLKYLVDHLNAGKPIIGIRTSTHAFEIKRNKQSAYAKWDWRSKDWPGGFGQQVLGDTWISHHGQHGKESARGLVNGLYENHPVLRGVKDIWGPSDVYGIKNLPADAKVLVYGQTLKGMKPDDPPNYAKSVMPLIWTRDHRTDTGATARILGSTIGAAVDMESEDLRRLFVNFCYWSLGLGDKIPAKNNVEYVGEFKPTFFGFNSGKKGVKPSDHELK
jgi:hypothetical protein